MPEPTLGERCAAVLNGWWFLLQAAYPTRPLRGPESYIQSPRLLVQPDITFLLQCDPVSSDELPCVFEVRLIFEDASALLDYTSRRDVLCVTGQK